MKIRNIVNFKLIHLLVGCFFGPMVLFGQKDFMVKLPLKGKYVVQLTIL